MKSTIAQYKPSKEEIERFWKEDEISIGNIDIFLKGQDARKAYLDKSALSFSEPFKPNS